MEINASFETAEGRVAEARKRLDSFREKAGIEGRSAEVNDLVSSWGIGLALDLQPAVDRELHHSFNHENALVMQFASAFMSDPIDAEVINRFF